VTQPNSPGREAGDADINHHSGRERPSLLRHIRAMAPRRSAAAEQQQARGRSLVQLRGASGANRAWDLVPRRRYSFDPP